MVRPEKRDGVMAAGKVRRRNGKEPGFSGTLTRFLSLLLLAAVGSCVASLPSGAAAPPDPVRPISMAEARENDENGVPVLAGQIVTLSGVAVVDTGKWHNAANYFALVSEGGTPGSRAGVLIYLPGSTQPPVPRGQVVRVTGELGVKGYTTDVGSTVIVPRGPEEIVPLSDAPAARLSDPPGILEAEPPQIPTDATYAEVERYEGTSVTIEGRLSQYDNETITRGFCVDGSRDGEIEDGRGAMNVKLYDYAGIEIGAFGNGDYVRVTGILMQGDETPPYTGFYYLRPTRQEDLVRVPEKSLPRSEEPPASETMSFQNGAVQRVADCGLYRLTTLTSGTDFPLLGTFHPAWHPDGSMIALSLSKEQNQRTPQEPAQANLFLMRFTDHVQILPLTFDPMEKQEPAWSPDGSRLVYAGAALLDEPGGNWDLFVLEGLHATAGTIQAEATRRLTETGANERSPVWAPDGRHIAFRSDAGGNWDLFVMDTATGRIVQATSHPGADAAPTWSPDGAHLAFQSDRGDGRWTIWTVPVHYGSDGSISGVGEPRVLVPNGREDVSLVRPAWSPDGNRIAFMSNAGGDWDIWVAPVAWNGTEPSVEEVFSVRMPGPSTEKHPAWDPGGDRLVFVSDQGGSWNLWAANIPGALAAPEVAGSGEERPGVLVQQPLLSAAYPPPAAFEPAGTLDDRRATGGVKLLWPRLASPAVISGGEELTVLVAASGDGLPGTWRWRLVPPRPGGTVERASHPLTLARAMELSAAGNRWVAAPGTEGATRIWEVSLAVPRDLPEGLYDLALEQPAGVAYSEPHSVAVRTGPVPGSFTFAIVTDLHLYDRRSRGADPSNPLNAQVRGILEEIEALKPDFVLVPGDIAQSTADTYHRDYPHFRELVLEYLSVPLFAVMGNHDGQVAGFIANGFEWWVNTIGPLYYSFDYGNWHFVGVNSYDHPTHRTASGTVGQEQLRWLEEDLAAAAAAGRQMAVFMHHNPYDERWVFMDESRREVVRLFERYGVKAVFIGHRHSDQLDESETTRYVTTRTAQAAAPELCGYRVVKVEDGWLQLRAGK